MKRQILLQPAFILHTKPYLNSSLIVTVFTRDHGILKLIAKGARRSTSKTRGMIQPFVPLTINYINKSSLGVLTDIEQKQYTRTFLRSKLVFGMYVNELMVRLLHDHDPHTNLFAFYQNVIQKLSTFNDEESTLREFEILLLKEIGYGIDFFKEAQTGETIQSEQKYHFINGSGFEKITSELLNKKHFTGMNITKIGNLHLFDKHILADAKYILRIALANKLGRNPIISRKLIVTNQMVWA